MIVLGSLVRLANLAPAPVRFDVFAADPIDAAPGHAVAHSAPAAPRPRPIAAPPKGHRPQPARSPVSSARAPRANAPSPVVPSANSVRPPDSPIAPTAAVAAATTQPAAVTAMPPSPADTPSHPSGTAAIATVPVSVPSDAPADTKVQVSSPPTSDVGVEGPLPGRPASESFPVFAPPTEPSIATKALPPAAAQAGVLPPVPAMPLTVAAAVPMLSLLEAAAVERQPVESPREMAAAARSESESMPATTAGGSAPVAAPWPGSAPVAMRPTPPPGQRRDPEPSAQAAAAPDPESVPPPPPPIRIQTGEQVASSMPAAPKLSRPSPITGAAPTAPHRSDSPAAGHGSSPLGLGLGRLRIRLDGASMRTTDRETEVISGTLVGGQPERVVVQVDDRMRQPKLNGRLFTAAVKLLPGINQVRVLATDAAGAEVEEVVTVQYVPAAMPDVAITSPRDGHTLAPDDPPLVTVQGEARDPSLTTVWIVANDRRLMVPVTAGRFRHVIPVVDPIVRVRAETGTEGARSPTVTVHAAAAMPAIGLFLGDWSRDTAGPARMTVTWRPNPAKLDGGAGPLPLSGLPADTGEAGADFFYLRNVRPGVYTFLLTYRAGAASAVRPVLYVAGASRPLQPMTLDGSGRAVVARLLLPQGVLWEQDDWFTGRSASGDTVTKFRFPDGVSWTERLGDFTR